MSTLPYALYRTATVRELDRIATEEFHIPGYTLMQRAGQALLVVLRQRWPQAKRLGIVAGMGNNGGDGLVLARLARRQGLEVYVALLGEAERLAGDARQAWLDMQAAGDAWPELEPDLLTTMDVVVDALFGSGLDREVSGDAADWIQQLNNTNIPILAADIPSGLQADTGQVLGAAIQAQATVSLIGLKPGLFTGQGPACCGQVYYTDLGVPPALFQRLPAAAQRIDYPALASHLTPRRRDAHKGDFGHVLLIGGDYGMSGAIRLAAEAALRCGAGLVSIATRSEHAAAISAARPELMCHAVATPDQLRPLLRRASVIVIGPGLGQSAWAAALLASVLEQSLPCVVDADALNLLAREAVSREQWILTPHPGEAARLLDLTTAEIARDRLAAAEAIQRLYGGICVLKGAGTVVQTSSSCAICSEGNPGMATAGMGDVLTGIIAGLFAQGYSAAQAAQLGVCLHAHAADIAGASGQRGLLASDLLIPLRQLLNPVASSNA